MKKPSKNKIDQLIENLSVEFSKIPNFELTQTDTDANRIFNLIISKFSDIQDFKTLYKELSKKESLIYCSQNMHEKFTHLFIEYKELLK